jgi:hypothetical protein
MKGSNPMKNALAAIACMLAVTAWGIEDVITFTNVVTSATSYGYDGEGDDIDDVIFSSVDPAASIQMIRATFSACS